jgi:RNA polymerase sigma factor (sigma-70 family)
MSKNTNEDLNALADRAAAGDRDALEAVIAGVQDMAFSLSLRMLGTFADAEDAAQEILMKILSGLPSFRQESAFTTWAFRVAVNHLKNYKKHMFAHAPLNFEFYGNDIENADLQNIPDLSQNVEQSVLAEELKLSCTNVMLQCLDPESRCIFVLGTMFKADSRMAGEILGITPEAYRQRLSRVRGKMAQFLSAYCGEYGSGKCRCRDRINYAIRSHRLDPAQLDYTSASSPDMEQLREIKGAMEEIDGLSQQFSFCKMYQTPERLKEYIRKFLDSPAAAAVKNA